MIEGIIISLLVFFGCLVALICGYKLGYKNAELKYCPKLNGGKIIVREVAAQNIPKGVMVQREEIIDEPSGIVYRPTAEELKKMNEDEVTKEVKAAMKETFDNAQEPMI